MTLTLLIDLDDTLLRNNMNDFIPAYLGALGKHVAQFAPPEKMVQTMMAATQKMFENNRSDRTLKEAFDPDFYPPLGWVESEMVDTFDQFYNEKFPALQPVTQTLPGAKTFIKSAVERGYRIGIATNPLFPRTAIVQRLAWAGFPEDQYPFELIPSYETFHFAKPNPAYFAEFLTRMGWPDGPTLMVGNDPDHDVRGARSLGLPVFWISDGDEKLSEGQPLPTVSGALEDILPWIDSADPESLTPDYAHPAGIIGILRGSPAALQGMLSMIPASRWTKRPQPGEWCLTEIVCHLRDVGHEINLPRVQKILDEENPFIHGIDSDAWAGPRKYIEQDGRQALIDYMATRIQLLEILAQLEEDDWERPARHAIFGPTTLKEMVNIMASHEQLHGRQIYHCLESIRE